MHSWMKPLLPLVAALAAPGCSFPCNETDPALSPSVKVVRGPGQLVLTCASTKQTVTYPLESTWNFSPSYDLETKKHAYGGALRFKVGKTDWKYFNFEFDSALADGSYPIGKQAAQSPVTADLELIQDSTGSFAFTRSRDVPFVDESDPSPSTRTSTLDVTLELKGQLNSTYFDFDCPELTAFTVESTTLHLEKTTTVGTCDSGDVLDELGNIKGGGH